MSSYLIALILTTPVTALAALDQPGGPDGQIGLLNLILLTALCCIVGWVAHQVTETTQRFTPDIQAIITIVCAIFGGPLLWWLLDR